MTLLVAFYQITDWLFQPEVEITTSNVRPNSRVLAAGCNWAASSCLTHMIISSHLAHCAGVGAATTS